MFKDINEFDATLFSESLLHEKLSVYTKREFQDARLTSAIAEQHEETLRTARNLEKALISAFPFPAHPSPDWRRKVEAYMLDWKSKGHGTEDSDGLVLGTIAIGHRRIIELIPRLVSEFTSPTCAQHLRGVLGQHSRMLKQILSLPASTVGFLIAPKWTRGYTKTPIENEGACEFVVRPVGGSIVLDQEFLHFPNEREAQEFCGGSFFRLATVNEHNVIENPDK